MNEKPDLTHNNNYSQFDNPEDLYPDQKAAEPS